MTNRAYVIKVNGTTKELDHRPTLDEAQEIVGGWVEMFPRSYMIDKKLIIYGNEEGLQRQLPVNKEASKLVHSTKVVGDILVLEGWRSLGE